MTRAAPAELLGLTDRGHLGAGARADIAVYRDQPDRAKMFGTAHLVFKDGALVVRDGAVIRTHWGRTLSVGPEHDRAVDRRMDDYCQARYGRDAGFLSVPESALPRPDPFWRVSCAR